MDLFSGLLKEPKWGHLRDLHAALKLCKKALFKGNPSVETFGEGLEVSHQNIKYNEKKVTFKLSYSYTIYSYAQNRNES